MLCDLPQDTVRRAWTHMRDQSTRAMKQNGTGKNSHAPIWQFTPRVRARLEVIIKLVNRAAHMNSRQLPRRVRGTSEPAELSVPMSTAVIQELRDK